jgi:hypothetical protein
VSLSRSLRYCAIGAVGASVVTTGAATAQEVDSTGVLAAVFVGSETENYLRILQTLGVVQPYPWTIRGFSGAELQRVGPTHRNHPLTTRPEFRGSAASGSLQWEILPVDVGIQHNTAHPYGMNDGAVWAGRGLTSVIQAGAAMRWKALSLVVAPIAFRSENRTFELAPNGRTGVLQYADPTAPSTIDRPQRFGERPYERFDPGETTLRVDVVGLAAGASTASQWWGPAIDYPFLLGNNAGGFPHIFVGTGRPANVWIGRVHGRVIYGELAQSDYTNITGLAARRFASGIIGVFSPRVLPGLELGVARFYHTAWPEGGLTSAHIRKPLEGFWKRTMSPRDPATGAFLELDVTNQLASFFVRWVLPRSGFEVYGEFGREDHSWDSRDFYLEPDHESALGLGFRKAWARGPNRILALRGEILDFRTPVLWRHRTTGSIYTHAGIPQGHTNRGQLLGAELGVNSSQAIALVGEHYSPWGKLTISWRSWVRRDGSAPLMEPDVEHVLGLEQSISRGPLELVVGGGGAYDFNRDFGQDARNFYGTVGIRWWPYRGNTGQ